MPEILEIGVLAAFLAGAISFLSPYVLPLAPSYVSHIAGQPDTMEAWRARLGSLLPYKGREPLWH